MTTMSEYRLRGRGVMAPDWTRIINDLLRIGVTTKVIGDAMGQQMTDRMIRNYRVGMQPSYWRGELLVGLWCKQMSKQVEDVPRCEVIRGHRVNRNRPAEAPSVGILQPLVDWLKPTQAPAPAKKKGGRRKKVEVAT